MMEVGRGILIIRHPMKPERKHRNRKHRQQLSNLEAYKELGYTVYALWCPLERHIKYIGYTSLPPWSRFQAHLAEAKRESANSSTDKVIWLKELADKGLMPVMRILRCFKHKIPAYRLEAELISLLKLRRPLANQSAGCANWGRRYGAWEQQSNWRAAE